MTKSDRKYIKDLYSKCKPRQANKVFSSNRSCNCSYCDYEETVLIIHAELTEINNSNSLCVGFIRTGSDYRGYGVCKEFLFKLSDNCKYPIVLADIVSKTLFDTINKYFDIKKIDYTLGTEDINENWQHYSDMYGSYIIRGRKKNEGLCD